MAARVRSVARKLGTRPAVAIARLLRRADVSSVVPGPRTPEQLTDPVRDLPTISRPTSMRSRHPRTPVTELLTDRSA